MAELRHRTTGTANTSDAAAPISEKAPVKAVKAAAVPSDWVTRHEHLVPWIILLVAGFTRFYRLDQPPGVVFDESHFGKFTGWYTKREYYFDIHPPLGKLTLWAFGKLVGYDPYVCRYETISEHYAENCKFLVLRMVSASFSTLTCVLMYFIARGWGAGVWGGILASGLLIFDMLALIEGRLILLDAQLIFWLVLSLYVAQLWWARLNEDAELEDAARAEVDPAARAKLVAARMGVRERVLWALGVGIVCGNAFSVKMTGLATPAAIGLESCFAIFFLRRAAPFPDMLGVLAAGASIYIWWFRVHYWVMVNWSIQTEEFETPLYQSTMIGAPHYDPKAVWEGFWWTAATLNKRMVVHNAAILAPHHWQSKWYEWILNIRGVSYYGKDYPNSYASHIYLIGNISLHYAVIGAVAGFLLLAIVFIRYRRDFSLGPGLARFNPFFAQGAFCLLVYCINLAPYVGVARSTFIYHYMPALIYGELLLARLVETLVGPRYMHIAAGLVLLVIGGTMVFFAPWIYALPLTPEGHARRRLLPRWD